METMIIKCDSCSKTTEDFYNEIGWITIERPETISISGGRKLDGCADTFRYISNIKTLHFCCIECLLNYLYFKEGYFNSSKTLDEKLESIEPDRKEQVLKILDKVKLFIRGYQVLLGS